MPEIRIFATKTFTKWQHKSGLTDQSLIHAVQEMRCGIVDAHLAKGLGKKRVAHPGRGKEAVRELWLPPVLKIVGFLFLDS